MYKIAILGANRGIIHAKGYVRIPDAKIVGICDINDKLLISALAENGFDAKLGYYDFESMLIVVQPDILHVVTSPIIPRFYWLDILAKHNCIKLVVFEKPIALSESELTVMNEMVDSAKFHVVINHQRRYFQFADTLKCLLENNRLGDIRHIYASSYGEPMETGTHLMDLILFATGDQPPTVVQGMTIGSTLMDNPLYQCPDNVIALLGFGNVPVTYFCGLNIPAEMPLEDISEDRLNSEHFFVYRNRMCLVITGTRGYFWWQEYGNWGYRTDTVSFKTSSDFYLDTDYAQEGLSQANVDLVDGKISAQEHRCIYSNARLGMDILLGVINGHKNER